MIKYKDGDSWKDAVLDYYPVGALYFSFSNTSPADLFGGSWSELTQAGYMIGVRGKASAGNTGGQKKLTVNNLPAHTHSILYGDNQGNNAGSGILSSVFSGSYGFYGYNPDFKTRLWTDDFALAGSTAGGGADYQHPTCCRLLPRTLRDLYLGESGVASREVGSNE